MAKFAVHFLRDGLAAAASPLAQQARRRVVRYREGKPMLRIARLSVLAAGLSPALAAGAAHLPVCLRLAGDETPRAVAAAARLPDDELLARLVYAESSATGFGDDARVARGIAWGVINRVRLAEVSMRARRQYGQGIAGVIFQPQQFNPAVSRRSPFARDFLCPRDGERWQIAGEAARVSVRGVGNPFIETPWERRHGLSLVVNFYYPQSVQAQGPRAPWEGSAHLVFLGEPQAAALPPAARVRFYRLAQPPHDLRRAAPEDD